MDKIITKKDRLIERTIEFQRGTSINFVYWLFKNYEVYSADGSLWKSKEDDMGYQIWHLFHIYLDADKAQNDMFL